MTKREAEFLQRLRTAFLAEARDHLQVVADGLIALEKAPSVAERGHHMEVVFRHTHSLKGAARAASFPDIEALCQGLEDVFSMCRRRGRILVPADFDVLHRAFDLVARQVDAGGASTPGDRPDGAADVLAQLQAIAAGDNAGPETDAGRQDRTRRPEGPPRVQDPATAADEPSKLEAPAPAATATATVRVETPRLDRVLLAAEELLMVRQAGVQLAADLGKFENRFAEWSKRWLAVQPAVRRLRSSSAEKSAATTESAGKILEFLDWTHGFMRTLEGGARTLARAAERDSRVAGKQIDELLEDSKDLLMLPFSSLSAAMPKLVRDLARDRRKQVELELGGDEVQLDKRVIELLRDPLIHLVRNAIDHGIETPEKRREHGKPVPATLRIAARLVQGDRICLEVADDGAGFDLGRLRQAAVKAGLMTEEAAAQLDDRQALDLAFRSDVSTSPIITEISGRGLGLAIVREQVERLGGRIDVEHGAHAGSRFLILLPQSVATLRGLFVEAGGQLFVIPSAHVERVMRERRDRLRMVSRRESVSVDGQAVALARLHQVLDLPAKAGPAPDLVHLVLVGVGSERLALAVDDVLHDEEVLVKRLNRPLVRVRNVTAATILPSGKPLPILHVGDLLKSARTMEGLAPAIDAAARRLAHRVLLAEDSITTRLLLKGILEAAGCDVTAVADGVEAITALRSESFDLLVSDIEMPRMNGFDLTARVRADPGLSDLPVVLVTALSRREDRERGIDVGANAYIAKGAFDQRELVDAVRRLAVRREPS